MKTVAEFSIKRTEYLNPEGEAINPLPAFAEDRELLLDFYRTMTLVRVFDKKSINLQRTGKSSTYASILGQEAISTAIGKAMRSEDVFVPYYRDYATQLQRNITMTDIFRFWGGDERGNHYQNSEDMPISVPIASQCLHAPGIALAFKIRKQPRVAVVTCGDGATSQGDFYEGMNVAGAMQLPVVFVVNNNKWAISVPLSKQTACETLAQKGIAAGITTYQVDGNDIIAMYEVMMLALKNARELHQPSLIEATTYRLSDHTTADDATRYRSVEEVSAAWDFEPIRRLRKYLEHKQWWNETEEQALLKNCSEKVEASVNEYLETPPAPVTDIFDYHFAQLPRNLEEQRALALEEELWQQ